MLSPFKSPWNLLPADLTWGHLSTLIFNSPIADHLKDCFPASLELSESSMAEWDMNSSVLWDFQNSS